MGLLCKALSQYALKLDDKGKKLRDRILRIAEKGTTPYTALSLLKTYGSFQCGICLYLTEGKYMGYASVGLGIDRTVIPAEGFPLELSGLVPPEDPAQRKGYYKIGSPALLSIMSIDLHAVIWAFPLDDEQPCRYILLLAEEALSSQAGQWGDSSFNPPMMARLLLDIRGVLCTLPKTRLKPSTREAPPGGSDGSRPEHTHEEQEPLEGSALLERPKPEHKAVTPPAAAGKAPESPALDVPEAIRQFYTHKLSHSTVQGILFALSGDAASVLPVLAPLGSIIPVASRYLLVLFQKSVDRELLAHRLFHSVSLRTVVSFEADTPEGLLALLQPYTSCAS
ncbi:MAG: hypothetical protein LBD93_02900 [Treponema sp.]|jgi:hypothetical protein|nr:hypothetical protein [Treponema sp.]